MRGRPSAGGLVDGDDPAGLAADEQAVQQRAHAESPRAATN
ncbi:hypothetical protein [Saccharothrix sp. ALI-22-I]|nr:hypothetical protein [Saccharothrix sp. ALI-22-I]